VNAARHRFVALAASSLATILLAGGCASSSAPELISVPQHGVNPVRRLDQISDYRTAAATVTAILHRDLGFDEFPVTFRLYPSREAFERALLASGYEPGLARRTAKTMTAVGGHRSVVVNEASLAVMRWPDRVAVLAHELAHSVQYELGGGKRGTSDQWLREGFADWLSIRVIEQLDVPIMLQVRRARQRDMRALGRPRAPRLNQLVTFPQWVQAGERHGAAAYALAFLAVDVLLERHGQDSVLSYFRRFAASDDRAGNFRAAFGEDIETFQAAVDRRVWGQ
jgi:hypothetical protein